jgi:hypothetical protein
LKDWQKGFGGEDALVIPLLNFDLWQEYDALYKEVVTPGPLQDGRVVLAIQDIRFRLDECGAILKSEARMVEKKCEAKSDGPRQFIFDKPFLLLLERHGAKQPYFAIWVDNPELLVPVK